MEIKDEAGRIAYRLALKGIDYSRVESRLQELLKRRGACIVVGGERICPKGRIFVVGAGKATGRMAETVESLLGELVEGGVISVPRRISSAYNLSRIQVIGGGHPLPDEGSLEAGRRILALAEELEENDLALALISGGGSALMEAPMEGVSLDDLRTLNNLLLRSGATIHEINTVRKHLSRIKGGRLAEAMWPAQVMGLIVSDVPGDRLDMVASGPTVPDPTTYTDALRVLERYRLIEQAPKSVVSILKKGASGELAETPKPGSRVFERVDNRLVATSLDALTRLAKDAEDMGLNTLILTTRLEGESREVGRALASIALEILDRGIPIRPPAALLLGGETYVRVRGSGRGGRNSELALSFAISVRGEQCVAIAAFDTDGIDGVTDAAGAVAGPWSIEEAVRLGLDPYRYLDNNDSYTFFKKIGGLIVTGPTHTNLKSMAVVVVGCPEQGKKS